MRWEWTTMLPKPKLQISRQPVNYAGRVAERTADNVRKLSVLAQLHAKQAERSAESQKFPKRKSHDMEL